MKKMEETDLNKRSDHRCIHFVSEAETYIWTKYAVSKKCNCIEIFYSK